MKLSATLAVALLSCVSFIPAMAASGNGFFGLSTGMTLPQYPACKRDAPDSVKPNDICLENATSSVAIDLDLSRYPEKSRTEFILFEPTVHVLIGDKRQVEFMEFSTVSKFHDQLIKLLVEKYGMPQKSKDTIGNFYGDEFDATGDVVHGSYNWKAGDTEIIYRPYLSSVNWQEGVLQFKTERGIAISQALEGKPKKEVLLDDEAENLIGPLEKAGCLDGICVGKPASGLSAAAYPWETPSDLVDLDKELAAFKPSDDVMYINAQNHLKNSLETTKSVYIAPDEVIHTIAKINHAPDSGNQDGVFVPFSFLETLSRVQAACKPLVWDLHYQSKSGYPTIVSVAWGPKNKTGEQFLRIEKIVRVYKDADTPEKQYALKEKLEQAIGLKMSGMAGKMETVPRASMMGNELTIMAPLTLNYDSYAGLLALHPSCKAQIKVD